MDKRNLLDDDNLTKVSGGDDDDEVFLGYFHTGCGGQLKNPHALFAKCVCAKCGETHYFRNSYNLYEIRYWPSFDLYVIGLYGSVREKTPNRPPELDLPCNQF